MVCLLLVVVYEKMCLLSLGFLLISTVLHVIVLLRPVDFTLGRTRTTVKRSPTKMVQKVSSEENEADLLAEHGVRVIMHKDG